MPQTDGIEAKPANIKSEISLQSGKITMQCSQILLQTGEVPLQSDETLQSSLISLQSSGISMQCSELSLQSDEVKGKTFLELCYIKFCLYGLIIFVEVMFVFKLFPVLMVD